MCGWVVLPTERAMSSAPPSSYERSARPDLGLSCCPPPGSLEGAPGILCCTMKSGGLREGLGRVTDIQEPP